VTDLHRIVDEVDKLRDDVDYLMALAEPGLAPTNSGAPSVLSQPFTSQTSSSGPSPSPAAAHVWHTLTCTEAARAWTTLSCWVDWLVERYQLTETLPACWYRHGAMIDELDALRAAWTGAYLDPTARPPDPALWHQLLANTLIRVRGWDRYGCVSGTHHDDVASATDDQSRQARDRYLEADVDARSAVARARKSQETRQESAGGTFRGTPGGTPTRSDEPDPLNGPRKGSP
jgi:hypothetical protein